MQRLPASWMAVALLALLLSACGASNDDPTQPPGNDPPDATPTATSVPTAAVEAAVLNGTRWLLTELDGVSFSEQLAVTFSFTEAQAGGEFAGCIVYGGAYSVSGSVFSLPEVFSNADYCEETEGLTPLADAFYGALETAAGYRLADDRLELMRGDGTLALVFSTDLRPALDGTSWIVIELKGGRLIDNTFIRLAFDGGRVSGASNCHTFEGPYAAGLNGEFAASELTLTVPSETQFPCDEQPEVGAQDEGFVAALAGTPSYWVDARRDLLELSDERGEMWAVLASEDQTPRSLLGWSDWVLTDLAGEVAEFSPPFTLVFANFVLGDAGCLSFMADILAAPDGDLRFPRPDWYADACGSDGPGAEAAAYRVALESVTQYSLSSNRLELLNLTGDVVLGFRPGLREGTGLEGAVWTLLTLGDAPVIPGTTITFGLAHGGIQGSSGCNGYYSQYIVPEPGRLSLFETVSTAMGCSEPSGIQEQESAYQATLSDVTAYRVTDTQLELLDAAGDVLLVFERAAP